MFKCEYIDELCSGEIDCEECLVYETVKYYEEVGIMKYIMLFNLFDEDLEDEKIVNKLNIASVDYTIKNYGVISGKREDKIKSIWVREDQYLIAWTIVNYEELLGITFLGEEFKESAESGVEWLKIHKENSIYVSEI